MGYIVGIVLAFLVSFLARLARFDRDRAFYPTVLAVVASYYVLFAVIGGSHHALTVDVPGAGFVWVVADGTPPAAGNPNAALAVPNLLRNDFFEVHLNETTGGIAQIKGYGRSPNRLSQQLNYRFTRERTPRGFMRSAHRL